MATGNQIVVKYEFVSSETIQVPTDWMCCGKLRETDEDGITTTYTYNSAHELTEITRAAVYDGDTCITPEIITEYTRDAAGRVLATTRHTGAMQTSESTAYDALGRVTSRTDVLGRVTTTAYSADGLTTTVTNPAGATFVTIQNPDGSTREISGTGQRKLVYSYDLNGSNLQTTVRNADGDILSQTITNGFNQTVVQAQPNTLDGFIYTRSEYNAGGLMVKQYQDTGWNTEKTAPTLYEYDSFGNQVKQTLALADTPTKDNSPVVEMAYSVETAEDGVYSVTTQTRYNAAGQPLMSTQKQLISQLNPTLESKVISVSERSLTSMQWSVYNDATKRTQYSLVPTSNITAEAVTVDGFALSQKDTAGIVTTAMRSYTTTGMELAHTDGRGNTTTTVTDIAGRSISVTDAAGNTTTTVYCTCCDQPTVITDAMGNTTCYKYDHRGRKIAEWGTATQPVCFGYDDADNMVSLTTYRNPAEDLTTDPADMQGDVTTWVYDPASGLELRKTYADNSSVVKTYDAYNRLATETNARGKVKTHSYETTRGLLLGTTYSDATTPRSYEYNHLGQLTQVTDAAGVRTIGYNSYGEQETDSLLADGKIHLITETRDALGRSTGYTYAKDGSTQQTVTTGYGADGRIATAGFLHGGSEKQFSYEYLPGSNLLQKLTLPSNMTLTQSYEEKRDLLTDMAYHRGTTLVTQRTYSYDTLGRPTSRNTARQGAVVNDTFGYNTRSELTGAQVNNAAYTYDYDNIGNRAAAVVDSSGVASRTDYLTNNLNQYIMLSVDDITDFIPEYDADGNQIRVKTSTGIWAISYDAENRPTDFTKVDSSGSTTIHCEYDYMGRRSTKMVTTNGNVTLHQRYLYRVYLQIACVDLSRASHPALWFITWDPTQPIATRPLAIQKDATWYTYGWDLTKNICEVYGPNGNIRTAYTYSPYGEVTSAGDVTQPIQWSSEFNDTETALVYYNYRHYNPVDGRWTGRDVVGETIEKSVYIYINKNITSSVDIIGLAGVAKFAHWVKWKLETFGKDIHGANIERIAKYASEITDAHVYEIAQTIHVVTNTARPIRGNQIRYFVFASCECDDGCQLLNNLGATFSIKLEHFVVKPSKLGVGGDDCNRGFSAYLPVPTDKYDEYVQKMTKNKITKLNKWCMDFCEKVEN